MTAHRGMTKEVAAAKARKAGASRMASLSPRTIDNGWKATNAKEIPLKEWKVIQKLNKDSFDGKVCHWFQSSMGCHRGNSCDFKHICMQCGRSGHGLVRCSNLSKENKQALER